MKEINYYLWSFNPFPLTPERFINKIKSLGKNLKINLFSAEEYEVHHNIEKYFTAKFKKYLIKNNITLNFIFGSSSKEWYDLKYHDPKNNMNVHLWPSYWMYKSYIEVCHSFNVDNFSKLPQSSVNQFDYLYITTLNRGRNHRCILLDLIKGNDLFNNGAISWANSDVDISYRWKYFSNSPNIIKLSDNYHNDKWKHQFIPPSEFYHSFVSIVSETDADHQVFITEKTAIPLIFSKPFLVQGYQGFYKKLKDLGFKLYDEIFDYSFDDEPNKTLRTDMILKNVKKLKGKDLSREYEKIQEKLLYNRNHIFNIAKNKLFAPDIVLSSKYAKEIYELDRKVKKV